MKRTYYVAYGSNLNIAQMRFRCKGATPVGVGYLKDWELFYAGSFSGNYATIREKKGGIVPVGVWLISEENEKALDRYEGWPRFYSKQEIYNDDVTAIHRSRNVFPESLHREPKPAPDMVRVYMSGGQTGNPALIVATDQIHSI